MKILIGVGVLVLGFVLLPADRVAPYWEYTPGTGMLKLDSSPIPGTEKSGLWMAVEGRLRWLGVLRG